jgi:ribonuclease E
MTRKRMGTGLLEVFGEQCETCAGRGVVTHDDPVEHRRANTVAAEHHVQRADSHRTEAPRPDQRPDTQRTDNQAGARGDRKRRRGRGGVPLDAAPSAPVQIHTVHPDPSDAERHAKAEATRVALANIAAAAHAAHLHDDEVAHAAGAAASGAPAASAARTTAEQAHAAQAPAAPAGQAPAGQGPSGQAAGTGQHDADAPGRPAAVLTFGGEKVALPFVEHAADQPQQPALTLDRLAEAFAHLGEPAVVAPEPAQAAPQAGASQAEPQAGAQPGSVVEEKDYSDHTAEQSRTRRPRRNRSASRAQGAANATSVEHHEVSHTASGGHSHAAKAPEPATAGAADKAPADAPIILGVGVPASEL